jgi:ubiquinone/menaquinone biosynthesis C-methylase UbiE
MELHKLFSTNRYGWQRFVFDHLVDLPPESRVLELGSGPGKLWTENIYRIPSGWKITLSDFSPGMVEEQRQNLADVPGQFSFEVVDAQAIPFPDATFDAVIANHMLYHVPDRDKAFSEIKRVLKPGGRFFAATNGKDHLKELGELALRFDPNFKYTPGVVVASEFSLDNGVAQLAKWFPNVRMEEYKDNLEVTEAEPLLNYILSTERARNALAGERLEKLRHFIEQEIAAQGAIHLTKSTGLFMMTKE